MKTSTERNVHTPSRGVSFVELLITAAVITLVFGGLMVTLQYAVNLISTSKAESGALALANERLEYIRSLPYNTVGTIAGIPNGPIPQTSTTSLNGITYTERVLVQYVDAPDDGYGAADANGILADYKLVKVEYTWSHKNGSSSIFLLSNMVPPGIESIAGGGTLTVNVFNATVAPIEGASVRVYNDTTTSTIDVTTNTNASGIAYFAGAPAAANYQITVTKAAYSTDQTYSATTSNPSPATPHVAVIESAVSTMNFQIDALSDLTVRTIGPTTNGQFSDDFTNLSKVATSSDIALEGNSIVLGGGAGSYTSSGTLFSASTTPSPITSWDVLDFVASTSATTSVLVHVYEVSGETYTLIPDTDLPGNSAGFTNGPVGITGLNPSTYPTLALGATLATSDANYTPALLSWQIAHIISEPSIANVPFALTGNKVIGTTASASPVYKYEASHTTDGSGEITISDLEWDIYDLVLETGAYDIAEACNDIPYVLDPAVNETLKLTLVNPAVYTLRVSAVDGAQNPVIGATVEVSRTSFSDSDTTSSCGQVFFKSGLGNYDDYQVTVSASGYQTEILTDVEIAGDETLVVTLSPS